MQVPCLSSGLQGETSTMSFIIILRCPYTGKLTPVTTGDDDDMAEYPTRDAAEAATTTCMACRAFPYEIIEVEL